LFNKDLWVTNETSKMCDIHHVKTLSGRLTHQLILTLRQAFVTYTQDLSQNVLV